jgi:hypothetical protein
MLITTAVVRGAIIAFGIALVIAAPDETLRLVGLVAILFGAYRFYLLFRYSSSSDEERADDAE